MLEIGYDVVFWIIMILGSICLTKFFNEDRRYERCRNEAHDKERFDELMSYGMHPENALHITNSE